MKQINIVFTIESSLMSDFYGMLQGGFTIQCQVGTSVENLFLEQLGLDPGIVEDKISTIFLNGKPVDDIGKTTIQEGSVLALSGAMPGLVGATLRRKSPLSSFRQSISAGNTPVEAKINEGTIKVKLFNVLLRELGPAFLRRGIIIQGDVFLSFITLQADGFWEKIKQALVNGKPIQATVNTKWDSLLVDEDVICLKVLEG